MRIGSLCTGYGGLEMGLASVFPNTELAFVSDIETHINTLLEHHHPDVPNLGDLTTIDWENIEPVDILCAGYPCQPFSEAGQRKGEQDERAIFGYIADGISVLRPRNVLLENVAGHLTLGGVGVITELTRLGYDSRWGIVRASDAGAPHRRARLFIWATIQNPNSVRQCDTTTAPSQDTEKRKRQIRPTRPDSLCSGGSGQVLADTNGMGLQEYRTEHGLGETQESQQFSRYGAYEHAIRRWANIRGNPPEPTDHRGVNPAFLEWMMGIPIGYVSEVLTSRSAMLKALGNGVVPQQAGLAIRMLTQ